MNKSSIITSYLTYVRLTFIYLSFCSVNAYANKDESTIDVTKEQAVTHKSGYEDKNQLNGPTAVASELEAEDRITTPLLTFSEFDKSLSPWFDYKKSINEKHGFKFGIYYNALYQSANKIIEGNEDTAALGIIRFNGAWDLVGRGTKNKGTLYFNIDNRHKLGSDIAPAGLAGEVGYAGMTGTLFSDVGTVLVDLNYQQRVNDARGGFLVGRFDPNDYVFVSGYANPWTTFQNVAVLLNASVALPDASWGLGGGHWLSDEFYALGTINDANGLVTDNLDFFSGGSELWKALEFGWSPNTSKRYTNQVNMSFWHVDARDNITTESSYGVGVSANWLFDNGIMPIFRAGISKGDSPIYNETVTLGLTYQIESRSDEFGVAVNWGKSPVEALRNQITTEIFYKLQLAQNLAITPSIQLLTDPALNSEHDDIAIFGLRFRMSL
jgi:porin